MFNSKYKNLLKQILAESVPSKSEISDMKRLANELIKDLSKQKITAKIGGSMAKNTLIKKDNQDIDIFVQFKTEEETKNLEKILKKIKTRGKLVCIHGSRDYFRIEFPDVSLEIIPTVKCKDPATAQNITDLSLTHVDYVGGKIKRRPKLANEIRLAKIFCAASDCYGAESYIQGFSGYSLELLIIHFGSFTNFLKKMPRMGYPQGADKVKVIDIEKQFKRNREVFRELNESKLISPIILIDPTYKYRNVTAALTQKTLNKFTEYTKEFLKNPTREYFQKKLIDEGEIISYAKKSSATYLKLEIETEKQEGDIAGTKMKKFHNFFQEQLRNKEQNILLSEFAYNGSGQSSVGYVVVKEVKRIEVEGPKKEMKEASKKFLKGKKEIFEKKGSLWTMENVSIKKIFNSTKKQQSEMGVSANITIK
ncbi:hypothetical protein HN747_02745 [archaeon]|jgi:tRNA nucleotidyltransferase (CCA-adding enzyme)|nr:hypothetical protein [archaeon]